MPIQKIVDIVKPIISDIHSKIGICNKLGQKKSNKFFAPLVLLSQQKSDEILADTRYCFLERILMCANEIRSYGAGNCMLQCFVAFDSIKKKMISSGLATQEQCVSISIYTNSQHAFLVLGNELICDPWQGIVASIKDSPLQWSEISEYFGIRSNWHCYDDTGHFDSYSTFYTFEFLVKIQAELIQAVEPSDDSLGPTDDLMSTI